MEINYFIEIDHIHADRPHFMEINHFMEIDYISQIDTLHTDRPHPVHTIYAIIHTKGHLHIWLLCKYIFLTLYFSLRLVALQCSLGTPILLYSLPASYRAQPELCFTISLSLGWYWKANKSL